MRPFKRPLMWSVLVFGVALIAIVGWSLWPQRQRDAGVGATVTNTGANMMRDVRLNVTGRSYALGDIPPGASRSARVNPSGESHLVVTYLDGDDKSQALEVDCYFESGYRGSIDVDVKDGKVARVDKRITTFH